MKIVSDPTANRPEQIEDAVNTIGKSAHRLRVFTEIYKGKRATKTISFLMTETGLDRKQILTAGKALADGNLVEQTRVDGQTGYTKISVISHIRTQVIRGVNKPESIKSQPTKRRPLQVSTRNIFRTQSRKTRKSASSSRKSNQPTHRIAFLTASPIGEDHIDVALEAREVQNELSKASSRDKFAIDLFPAATTDSLLTALNDKKPNIIHFSGHGNFSGLSLDNQTINDVGGVYLDFDILLNLLLTAQKKPQLLFLNACQSSGGADKLMQVCDVVIAMKDSVEDSTAFHYSRRFYASLFSGVSIKDAHNQAKAILAIDDPNGSLSPDIFYSDDKALSQIKFK